MSRVLARVRDVLWTVMSALLVVWMLLAVVGEVRARMTDECPAQGAIKIHVHAGSGYLCMGEDGGILP
jgi:hypothetical protein